MFANVISNDTIGSSEMRSFLLKVRAWWCFFQEVVGRNRGLYIVVPGCDIITAFLTITTYLCISHLVAQHTPHCCKPLAQSVSSAWNPLSYILPQLTAAHSSRFSFSCHLIQKDFPWASGLRWVSHPQWDLTLPTTVVMTLSFFFFSSISLPK